MATKLEHFRTVFIWLAFGLAAVMIGKAASVLWPLASPETHEEPGSRKDGPNWERVICKRCGSEWAVSRRKGDDRPADMEDCFNCSHNDMCDDGLMQLAVLAIIGNALERDPHNEGLLQQMSDETKEYERHLESCKQCQEHYDRIEKQEKNKPR